MRWLNRLTEFITGNSEASEFRDRMVRIGGELGIFLTLSDDGGASCAFSVDVSGESYTFVVLRDGERVQGSAFSKVRFPPGRLPPEVVSFLARKNRELEHCDFDCIETRTQSYFIVKSFVRWSRLTTDVIKAGVELLLPHIYALDAALYREGV